MQVRAVVLSARCFVSIYGTRIKRFGWLSLLALTAGAYKAVTWAKCRTATLHHGTLGFLYMEDVVRYRKLI